MFLLGVEDEVVEIAFLCLRRGVSHSGRRRRPLRPFSLPTQRCFQPRHGRPDLNPLFSAYAEVFPDLTSMPQSLPPFLCLRRGVSIILCHIAFGATFSLPTQRCFSGYCSGGERRELFSAYAEVFLTSPKISLRVHSFLCLRRGVSGGNGCVRDGSNFSLPTQRCFSMFQFPLSDVVLFSAYAEVFPLCHPVSSFFSPFLCLRRGVSSLLGESVLLECFSLPTQRCFLCGGRRNA